MNVAIIDLLTQSPFYDRYLSESLFPLVDEFCLYAVRFRYELDYFDDITFKRSAGFSDLLSRFPVRRRRPRQIIRTVEYCLNWLYLLTKFRRLPPDIVHIQWLPMTSTRFLFEVYAVRYLRHMGIPVIYTVHNYLPHDTGTRHFSIYQRLYSLVDHLVVHTLMDCERLTNDFAIPEKKVTFIPQGPVFFEQKDVTQKQAKKALKIADDDVVLLMLGVIRPYKGIEITIRALARIVDATKPLRVKLIIGGSVINEQYLRQLQSLADELGISSYLLWIPEYVPSSQVGLYHAAADIVLFPYHDISQSAAFLTAGGFGKFTITTPIGGFGELIQDGENGLQIASADPDCLADALQRGINLSPRQRAAMGHALQERIHTEYSWEAIGKKTVDLYQRVASRRSAVINS